MAIMRFDPMRGLETISRRMNDLFGDFEKGFSFEYGSFVPRIDISEDEKQVFIHAELPGLKKDDVKIKINDEKVLTISGEKKQEDKYNDKDENHTFIRVERSFGAFTRSFALPDNINTESINAKFENGVLKVSLDKKEPEKPKEVEITIA